MALTVCTTQPGPAASSPKLRPRPTEPRFCLRLPELLQQPVSLLTQGAPLPSHFSQNETQEFLPRP